MRIAFYSPLKSPDHPVPSGDRLMARLLMSALQLAGHSVEIASHLRLYSREPPEPDDRLSQAAGAEVGRIDAAWRASGPPDLWFCYHPYYKAPDLIGPPLSHAFGVAYVTAEASWSARRQSTPWAPSQDKVLDSVNLAAANICMTERDRQGLALASPQAALFRLKPFIDPGDFLQRAPSPLPGSLVTVAMMRPGDKTDSYIMLADALARLFHLPWTLTIIGDGPCLPQVKALFADFPKARIVWAGEKGPAEIAEALSTSSLYVWPGCGEAYGLAYLEAQAASLPVVAQAIAGVPEVVVHGRTGLLTPPGDIDAYAGAIERLLTDEDTRLRLGRQARAFVRDERGLDAAAATLAAIIDAAMEGRR